MPTANEHLQSLTIAHATYLERYKRREVQEIVALLNDELEPAVVAALESRLERIAARGFDTGLHTTARLIALKEAIDAEIAAFTKTAQKMLRADLLRLAKSEAQWQVAALEKAVPSEVTLAARINYTMPAPETLRAIVNEGPINGALLKDWFKNVEDNAKRAVTKAVNVGLAQGETTAQIVARVRGTKELEYADGALAGTRAQVQTAVQTSVAHTAGVARAQAAEANRDILKGEKWSSALDSRVCVSCAPLDGQVYEIGSGPSVPLHPNCLPGDSLVLSVSGIAAASERWFDGKLVTIKTARGRELSCTPNHPVLTRQGWLAARLLNVGSDVICDGVGEWGRGRHSNGENAPARIDHVAETFLAHSGVLAEPVPLSAPDFHGDGAGSKVAVIGSNRLLRDRGDSSACEHCGQPLLVDRTVGADPLAGLGARKQFGRVALDPANRIMGGRDKAQAIPVVHAGHARELLLGAIPQMDTALSENLGDGFACESKAVRNALAAYAGQVESDHVVSVRVSRFSGQVYNLQTGFGWYFAGGGILTHNCRCARIPVLKSWEELGIKGPKLPVGTRASMDGQVPADLTFGDWLKQQPVGRVQDVLGSKEAARAFLAGEVSITDFSTKMGRPLSWKQVVKMGV